MQVSLESKGGCGDMVAPLLGKSGVQDCIHPSFWTPQQGLPWEL